MKLKPKTAFDTSTADRIQMNDTCYRMQSTERKITIDR